MSEPTPETAPPETAPPGTAPRRPRRLLRSLGQWLIFLVLIFTAFTVIGRLRAPALSGEAPEFALRNTAGETVRLSDFRGQTVVLNFWATWCPPCRVELPAFARFARNNPDIAVLGLSVQSPANDLRAMVDGGKIPYPVLIVDADTAENYRVTSLPTTIIVSPEGEVRSAHAGVLFDPQLWWMTR